MGFSTAVLSKDWSLKRSERSELAEGTQEATDDALARHVNGLPPALEKREEVIDIETVEYEPVMLEERKYATVVYDDKQPEGVKTFREAVTARLA